MIVGSLLLSFAILPLIYDFLYLARHKNYRNKTKSQFIPIISLFPLIVGLLLFFSSFLTDDFTLNAVYSYSSSTLPGWYKSFATWSGSAGSLLLLTSIISLTYTVYRLKATQKQSKYDTSVYYGFDVTIVFFLILTLIKNPFETLSFSVSDGKGLNPALQSPWMAVHPPIVFAAYAFILLGFFLAVARIKTGLDKERALNFSLYAAWLLLTIGIILGGVWAYQVLGWGGYWSWDPIETGSLLPWLALTLYFVLHSIVKTKKRLLEDTAILMAVLSMFFVSALTRGGLLNSVHAYGLSPAGPILLFFALGMLTYFIAISKNHMNDLWPLKVNWRSLSSVSVFLICFSLVASFIVCLLGIAIPIIQNTVSSEPSVLGARYFEIANYPFLLIAVIGVAGLFLKDIVTLRIFSLTTIFVGVTGTVLAGVGVLTTSALVNFTMPLVLFAAISIIAKLPRIPLQTSIVKTIYTSLIFLGILFLLIGGFLSQSSKITLETNAKANSVINVGNIQIELNDVALTLSNSSIFMNDRVYNEYSRAQTTLKASIDGIDYISNLTAEFYPAYGLISTPTIVSSLTQDVYIHIQPTQQLYDSLRERYSNETVKIEDFTLNVTMIPAINLVWIGSIIMTVGILLVTLLAVKHHDRYL